jgi:hypothetical protein
MGNSNAGYDSNTIKQDDDTSVMLPDHDRGKVRFYSKDNFQGNIYEIERGNYTSNDFVPRISPDNVFSMAIPPQTYVKIYCGDIYDYGGKGFMHIENVTDQTMRVPLLPEYIEGQVKSVSIGVHSDIQTWAGSNTSNRYDKPSNTTVRQSPIIDDQVSIYTTNNPIISNHETFTQNTKLNINNDQNDMIDMTNMVNMIDVLDIVLVLGLFVLVMILLKN